MAAEHFSSAERRAQVRFFRLSDVIDRKGVEILSTVVDERKLKKILNLRLENPETREAFAKRFLDVIAAGLDADDKVRIIGGLVGIGMGVASLEATENETDEAGFSGSSVTFDNVTGKYMILLGNGTGGRRILLRPRRPSVGDGFERLLAFPSQGERISGKYQRAFQLLFGSRARRMGLPDQDADLAVSIVENNSVDICPCGSGKKFQECHGA